MNLNIKKKLLYFLIAGFITATIAGTISHELGHYIAAAVMGFKAHLSYGMTSITDTAKFMNGRQRFLFTAAGPFQTMLTGTIGIAFLFKYGKNVTQLSLKQWALVFISLFWLRQPANLLFEIISVLVRGRFRGNGDEIKLSRYLNIPELSVLIFTAIIGIILFLIVVFKFIPERQRLAFVLAGIIGGSAGYLFWLDWLGPLIMP